MRIVSNIRHVWDDLTFVPQRRDRRTPKRIRPIEAIDTETIDGQMWLLADSRGRYIFPSDLGQVLKWLEDGLLYRCTNFTWNLDYDARAILTMLDSNTLLELAVNNTVQTPYFQIDYVPRKFLTIRFNGHRYEFFDLMQYFNSSLNYAAKRYLGAEKDDIDAERINNDEEYRHDNLQDIVAYCIKDAELTARLGELNRDMYRELGVVTNRWYSTGYIAAKYYLANAKIPRMHNAEAQQYAYYAYAGGRFEVFRRGRFEDAHKYDISSAYPAVISTLPDLDNGHWSKTSDIDYDADLIYALVRVSTPEQYIQPLYLRRRGVVVYPTVAPHHRILTKSELEVIDDFGLGTYEVVNAWHFYANSSRSPFTVTKDIYHTRQELKARDDPRQLVLKVVMNSLYGKFIQVTTRVFPELERRVGTYFIPAYAAEITARTRTQLLRTTLERDMSPIAFFTDAILTDSRENLDSEGLGKWGLEKSGELVVIGCGVYGFIRTERPDTHLRGFSAPRSLDLEELLTEYSDKTTIPFYNKRPVSLGEWKQSVLHDTPSVLNQWKGRTRLLSINFDKKRRWAREWTRAEDVLRGSIDSVPIEVTV